MPDAASGSFAPLGLESAPVPGAGSRALAGTSPGDEKHAAFGDELANGSAGREAIQTAPAARTLPRG